MNSSLSHLLPERLDRRDLGKEAVTSDVEPVAFILCRARDAADNIVRLEHRHRVTILGELIGRGQSCRPGTNDHGVITWPQA